MPTITLATFRSRVYDRLDGNSLFFPLPEVDNAINEALRVNQCFIGYSMGKVTLINYTDAGRVIYDIPPVMSVPLEVYFNGRPLQFRSLAAMATEYRNWATQDSSFAGAVSNWAPIGVTSLAIQPADANGGNSLEVFGILDLSTLVSPTDASLLPDEFLSLTCDYAAHVCLLKMPGQMFQQSLVLYKSWYGQIKRLARWRMNKMPAWPRQARGVAV